MGLFSHERNSTSDAGRVANATRLEQHGVTPRLVVGYVLMVSKRRGELAEITHLVAGGRVPGSNRLLRRAHECLEDAEARLHNQIEKALRKQGLEVDA